AARSKARLIYAQKLFRLRAEPEGSGCLLLAQSGHRLVHCTCPLLGVKRTTQADIYSGLAAKMFFRPSVAQCSERVFVFTGLVSRGPRHICNLMQKLQSHVPVLLP